MMFSLTVYLGSGGCLEADDDEVFIQRCEEDVDAQSWTFV